MSSIIGYSASPARPSVTSLFGRLYGRIADQIVGFKAVNELTKLTDRQLHDIGVERRQIEAVAAREVAKLRAKSGEHMFR